MIDVSEIAPPCRFGAYELIRRLRSERMFEIFLARDPRSSSPSGHVVIQRLAPKLSGRSGAVTAFVERAKLAASIDHPNVARVLEFDLLDSGDFYVVSEHLAGTDLRELLRSARMNDKRIPPWFSVRVMIEVLEGLAHAERFHRGFRPRPVVHGAIAPDNVVILETGAVKLGCFRGVQSLTEAMERSQTAIYYVAPEQITAGPIDPRADVFSAGILLWELLAQAPLFRGATEDETVQLISHMPRVPPSEHQSDVTGALDACVLAAIDPDLSYRTASPARMLAQLRQALSCLPTMGSRAAILDVIQDAKTKGEPFPEVAIPMPGRPSKVETNDIIARRRAKTTPFELVFEPPVFTDSADPPVVSRSVIEIDRTMVHVDPYLGPNPFWLRIGGHTLGPCALLDLVEVLRSRLIADLSSVSVSADQVRWHPYAEANALVATESVEPETLTIKTGELRAPNLIHAFGDALLLAATGRMLVFPCPSDRTRYVEIHFAEGAPVDAVSRGEAFDGPKNLIAARIVHETVIEACVREALTHGMRLEDVFALRTGMSLGKFKTRLFCARVQKLLAAEGADFWWSSQAPKTEPALAPSMVSLLPRIVDRAFSREDLRAALEHRLLAKHRTSDRFSPFARALEIDASLTWAIDKLPLGEALKAAYASEKVAMTMGYVLERIGAIL